jgi:hypothetical protein
MRADTRESHNRGLHPKIWHKYYVPPRCAASGALRERSMAKLDIVKTNAAIERMLETTDNPRHRFLLMSYHRHRFLEIAGRYEELFAPDMMTGTPAYHFHVGGANTDLTGKEAVQSLYRMWADTNQTVFYAENEQVAVGDHFVASIVTLHQQVWGKTLTWNRAVAVLPGFLCERNLRNVLAEANLKADENDIYVYKNTIEVICPYDHRGRLIGEHVWEPNPGKAEITKLHPADVITTQEAASLLGPLIQPLPPFEEYVYGMEIAAH